MICSIRLIVGENERKGRCTRKTVQKSMAKFYRKKNCNNLELAFC